MDFRAPVFRRFLLEEKKMSRDKMWSEYKKETRAELERQFEKSQNKSSGVVEVRAHTRDGYDVVAHTRSAPGSGSTEEEGTSLLDKANCARDGVLQGVTFGWADEIEGGIGGAVYAAMAALDGREKPWDAAQRGYTEMRDKRRENLEWCYEKEDWITGGAEFVGAMATPIRFAKEAAKTAPLKVKSKQISKDATLGGIAYGLGVSEKDLENYIKNVFYGTVGAASGNLLANQLLGRGGNALSKRFLSEFVNFIAKQIFY